MLSFLFYLTDPLFFPPTSTGVKEKVNPPLLVSHSSSSFFSFRPSRTKLVLGSERFRWGVFFSPKSGTRSLCQKGHQTGLYSFLFLNEENGNEPTPVPSHNREKSLSVYRVSEMFSVSNSLSLHHHLTWLLSLDVVYRPTFFSIWFYIKHGLLGQRHTFRPTQQKMTWNILKESPSAVADWRYLLLIVDDLSYNHPPIQSLSCLHPKCSFLFYL